MHVDSLSVAELTSVMYSTTRSEPEFTTLFAEPGDFFNGLGTLKNELGGETAFSCFTLISNFDSSAACRDVDGMGSSEIGLGDVSEVNTDFEALICLLLLTTPLCHLDTLKRRRGLDDFETSKFCNLEDSELFISSCGLDKLIA